MREATSQVPSLLEHLAIAATEKRSFEVYGVDWNDPECIHTVDEAIEYINSVGFLPLFKNDIPGFSLEERTVPEYWWSGDKEKDPWEWRQIIAERGNILYGKFFCKKAGFITKEWFPYFANYRRDGYDFDALYEDGKASIRQKKIMDLFMEKEPCPELFSFEIKAQAGFRKDGEKNFEGTITDLEMKTYLCVRNFDQKVNKKGEKYGWAVAVYTMPETILGYDYVTKEYREEPVDSAKKIAAHMMDIYPVATADQIKRIIGIPTENRQRASKKKKVNYPANLIKALDIGVTNVSKDQEMGLEYARGLLKEQHQEIIKLRFEEGLTFKEIGERLGKSQSRCGQLCKHALKWLASPLKRVWIVEGYEGRIAGMNKLAEDLSNEYLKEGKIKQAALIVQRPEALSKVTPRMVKLLADVGIFNNAILRELMKNDLWTRGIPGIGEETGKKLALYMYDAGLIDETYEAYKEAIDHTYFWKKFAKWNVEYMDDETLTK